MSSRSKIEKWLLADWNTGNIPVGEDVKVLSLQPNEGTVAEENMVCKYECSFVLIIGTRGLINVTHDKVYLP